jgi:hypothetical protein
MRRITMCRFLLVSGTTLIVAGCGQDRGTEPNASAPQQPELPSSLAQEDLAAQLPGFGGFYLDQNGRPTVFLLNTGLRDQAAQLVAPFLRSQGLDQTGLVVRQAQYPYLQLDRWFHAATSEILGLSGTVMVDLDEATNRVRIGISDPGALIQAKAALFKLGIPEGGVILERVEPIVPMATLQSSVRPIVAGLQINFPGYLCSLGLNATHVASGQASFITASHCTNTQGGVESTPYWQPLQSTDPTQIATEVADPVYLKNIPGCPHGRRCRQSDASRAAYASGISFTRGGIAQTSGPNNGSLTIAGQFTITQQDNTNSVVVGQTVNKVGRTTGWTQGAVTNTCVNTGVSGSTIVLFCQTFVAAGVGGGDSGSDVFQIVSGTSVRAVGILWGGNSSGTQFVYSPLKNVQAELGTLTVTQ